MKLFLSILITGAVIFFVACSVFAASSSDRRGLEAMRQQSSPWAAIIGEND